ncbi:MAG: MetQ/NlpA family ABC transporter substrate-binding protein [Lautropia sp.]|nr:MetQ/NlpA family ABC transporter substrate-binding protein [Lautropia sp.]
MIRTFARSLGAAAILSLAVVGAARAETLSVGATPVPHAELLELVKPVLAKEGVELKVRVFNDYVQPIQATADKALDANFFLHRPYLDTFNKEHKTDIVAVPDAEVHVEPFGMYSRKVKKLDEIETGATVVLPNDPSNGGRALLLLQKAGLIKLKDPTNLLATSRDLAENPKKLKFREMDAAFLPRALDDADLALINTNYALAAGLQPTKDALVLEGADSPYVNIVTARPDNANSPAIAKLMKALRSEQVKKFIEEKYKGAIVPAF